MGRNDLVAAFHDTVSFSQSDALKEKTAKAMASTKVYMEDFTAYDKPKGHHAEILVENDTTFSAAKKYLSIGKTAVLNFANPVTPGGGARNGAVAQEECLCRSSNLYYCLTSSPFLDFYQYLSPSQQKSKQKIKIILPLRFRKRDFFHASSKENKFLFVLTCIEFVIKAFLGHQLFMCPLLYNTAVVYYENLVSVLHCGETVGDDEASFSLH